MVAHLETGRIHSLPVQVTYHLSSSSQCFSTLFPEPQDVYLHPTVSKSRDGEDEVWGAIYLKAVVQGIVMSSPELHPAHPYTPDLSLYLLDPRETFFKKLRAGPRTRSRTVAGYEVWSGKGLVSNALAEVDKGKSLITGRLVRRAQFLNVAPPPPAGLSALEALAAANANRSTTEVEAWGIEIFVGLKSGLSSSSAFPGPLHHTVESGSVAGIAEPDEEDEEEEVADSPANTPARPSTVARIPSFPAPRTVSSSNLPPRAIPRHHSSSSPAGPSRGRPPVTRKKVDERSKLSNLDMNKASSSPVQAAQIFNKLTDEQKNVLTPDVLSFLEKLAGNHGAQVVAKEKRMREEEVAKSDDLVFKRPRNSNSRPRSEASSASTYKAPISECSNCKATRSSVWRQQQMPNGETCRVCNACGLYYQKKAAPRPASMWTRDQDGVVRGRGRTKASDRTGKGERELKRTMTQAVEKDAQRIATNRRKPASRGKTPAMLKDAPQTSPSRGSVPLPHAVRVAAATSVAGSSPAGSSVWHGDDTPGPASMGHQPMQSLDMPLSDDGSGNTESQGLAWAGDLSAFFDVEGFSAAPDSDVSASTSPIHSRHRPMSSMDARNVSSALRNQIVIPTSDAAEPSDDAAWSELFNRTSSFGHSSSVGDRTSSFGRSSSFGAYDSSPQPHEKFDFSQLPPSSPPALPSNLSHSALLFSSPGPSSVSPIDPSPRDHKPSPGAPSGLRNEVTLDDKPGNNIQIQDILDKLGNTDILALFDNLPAA
ncbi:uncharacterized protein CcaverHIS019_0308370 [Cutaneotrichosporon cavernicola]|uniref:GATA-type domain-containing protein n=1 Tax=Cutaneotrichosporon cavernicola TaxID=279322 RepID=A0AA48ID69_9TREE|nr:uncharacterized protein CcaverHIS019_0308370 [Cutaneotrichosporon cavernicola]BEI90767.1 hypothetical protein CcaverHIS019_0308370 [Cutaneotrichosporon cavernicola]BEI98547.1 hypothetical protein CcaverHIS631_0308460 [Cutaneotrichosporon cavernicola]BEJ06318.1 hypothetical protein CcaverHIS641_0308400 [Cutaneotrichosporon cavernicola]